MVTSQLLNETDSGAGTEGAQVAGMAAHRTAHGTTAHTGQLKSHNSLRQLWVTIMIFAKIYYGRFIIIISRSNDNNLKSTLMYVRCLSG